MAPKATETVCPNCLIGEIERYHGALSCPYCGQVYAPSTTRARLRLWHRHEIEALERRLPTRREPLPFDDDAAPAPLTDAEWAAIFEMNGGTADR